MNKEENKQNKRLYEAHERMAQHTRDINNDFLERLDAYRKEREVQERADDDADMPLGYGDPLSFEDEDLGF